MESPEAVHSKLRELETAGIPIVERDDEPRFQAFKCLDPDGYKIQVYWNG